MTALSITVKTQNIKKVVQGISLNFKKKPIVNMWFLNAFLSKLIFFGPQLNRLSLVWYFLNLLIALASSGLDATIRWLPPVPRLVKHSIGRRCHHQQPAVVKTCILEKFFIRWNLLVRYNRMTHNSKSLNKPKVSSGQDF